MSEGEGVPVGPVGEAVELVADGDPCPKHGLESRLLHGPCGPFNQCAGCREDFLDWYAAQRYVVVEPIVLERRPKKEKGHRGARSAGDGGTTRTSALALPEPEQMGLAL